MILIIIFTITVMPILGVFLGPIFEMLGAGATIGLGFGYRNMVFGGFIFVVFTASSYGILRAEGNVKKLYILCHLELFSIWFLIQYSCTCLDGAGTGIATVFSMAIVSFIILYWFRKGRYINPLLKFFIFSKNFMKKLLTVGMPVGAEFLIMSILAGSLNMILVAISGVDAVVVYFSGYRVVMIAILPIISVSISVGNISLFNISVINIAIEKLTINGYNNAMYSTTGEFNNT